VPCGGYIDRIDYGTTEPDVNVHGPIARSVDDLELLLDLIASPRPDRSAAVRHHIPPARHARIDDYRVAVWSDAAACPSSIETAAAVEGAGDVLASLGASVSREARPDLDPAAASQLGTWLVVSAISPSLTEDEAGFFASLASTPGLPDAVQAAVGAYTASHREWLAADVARTRLRAAWHRFFGDVDVLVCPVAVAPPFHHVQEGTALDRVVPIDGVMRPYADLFWWTMMIGMAYLPVTVVPVGVTADGLPLAVQIVGPYMEDRTPLAVARALRAELGPMRFPTAPITPAG
jgi:amidase